MSMIQIIKSIFSKLAFTFLLISTLSFENFAKTVVYPVPTLTEKESAKKSELYKVEIIDGKDRKESFVYQIAAMNPEGEKAFRHNKCSFTTFEFDKDVIIEITKLAGDDIKSAKIFPSSYDIPAEIIGKNKVRFSLKDPKKKMAVIFNEDWNTNPLMIFGDGLEQNAPDAKASNVRYFAPGVHDVGKIEIKDGETVYLAGGSYVKGFVDAADLKNVKIIGRGIISTENVPFKEKNTIDIQGNQTANVEVEGVTMIQSAHFAIRIRGEKNLVHNVKIVGNWRPTTDGIISGNNSIIEDCFIKPNDDAIKLYHTGMTVRRNVIWQLENGTVFQLGWNWRTPEKNIRVYDNDIIRTEFRTKNHNRNNCSVIGSIGGWGDMQDIVFDDIRAENGMFRIISLNNKREVDHNLKIRDVTIRNLTVTNWENPVNQIDGESINNIKFENLSINGKTITQPNEANFSILNGAANIEFITK